MFKAAEKSLVLLKNNGILPLKNVKRIALIGPNADNFDILIGNYNGDPVNPVTPYKALRERLGAGNVLYTPGCAIAPGVYTNFETISGDVFFHLENGKRIKGLKAEYFNNNLLKGDPGMVRTDESINFQWKTSPLNDQLLEDQFSVRWSGLLIPKRSGNFIFGGTVRLLIEGKPVTNTGITLEKGKSYNLEATFAIAPVNEQWAKREKHSI